MSHLSDVDPDIHAAILGEDRRQKEKIILVASENRCSPAVREAAGSVMTDKYAEGYPGRRYYGGCEWVDKAENLARDRARELFGCDHVNVQPHSGSQANMAVYFAMLEPGDCILSMDLAHGGHLSHGFRLNFSGMLYDVKSYGVASDTEEIDYDEVERIATEEDPALIVCGASAYSRIIDFERFAAIAEKVDALLMADIAHIAGLIAASAHPNPVPHADFVTTTTHKTLRGPRGGMIMCRDAYKKKIDKIVMPGIQGGPLCHLIAAKAVAFKEALTDEFKTYQRQIVVNARALADAMAERGYRIVSGGTDNHLFLVDLRNKEITGKKAEAILDEAGIVLNKNLIPFDPAPPLVASGIRIGTPAVTSRGMTESEMGTIAELIDRVLSNPEDESVHEAVKEDVKSLTADFPF